MEKKMCKDCERYKAEGHNYCRMCGFHVRKGLVNNTRIAIGYNTDEKFCGYCGEKKRKCKH